jgi:hypothetical protein
MSNFFTKLTHFFFPWWSPNQPATIRYAFPLIFTFVAVLGATALLSTGTSSLVIEVDKDRVYEGEEVQIDIYVVATAAVNAVDIKLELPVNQLELLSVDTGRSVISLWTKQPYFENGVVYFSGGTYRRGFIGKHLIGSVKARARTSGLTQLTFSDAQLYSGDGSGKVLPIQDVAEQATNLYVFRAGETIPVGRIEANASLAIIGDLDGDGLVTLRDISMFMSAWRSNNTVYDLTGDGNMTFRDFSVLLSRYFFQ